MKKLLSLLGLTTIVVSGSTTAVACGNDPAKDAPTDVVFMIDASTTTSSSIINAYKDVVTDFNENYNNSDIKVTIETPSAGQILNSIMADEVLPDLYLTYPDNVARYKSLVPDQVMDVKDEGYIADDTTFNSYQNSFLEEGTIGEDLYVLPVLKSFDVNTINLRLLKEMVDIFKDSSVNYNENGVFLKNELGLKKNDQEIAIEASDLFVETQTYESPNKDLYNSIAQASSATALRDILQLDSNVAKLAADFKGLKTKNSENAENKYSKAYAIGIDSMENKVFANYANNSGKQRINTSSENKDFLYNYYNEQLYVNNTSGVKSTEESIAWLESLRKIENPSGTGSLNSSASDLDSTGTLFVANSDDGKKIYSSSYFAQGSMLMASGSSAGSFYYSTSAKDVQNGNVQADVAVATTDLFLVAQSTTKGGSYIMQQGPGIGAFKSSSDEKSKIAKEFSHFLMNKDNMAQMAIWTGYMPSNELSYTGTDYNEWIKGTKKVVSNQNGKEYDRTNLILAQIVNLLKDKSKNNFATIESSEPGNAIRDKVFKNTIQAGMYKSTSELTMNKFWNGEKVSGLSYTGATEQFNTIATDLDPTKKAQFEASPNKAIILNRKED